MVFTKKTFDQMLEEIDVSGFVYFSFESPLEVPESHKSRDEGRLGYYLNVEQKVVDILLSNIPSNSGIIPDRLLEAAIHLSLENSLTRGHNCELYLPYSIKLFAGREGVVFRIRDSGSGFDYQRHIPEKEAGGRGLTKGAGIGTIILTSPVFEACYEGTGSVLNIMVKKGYCPERSLALIRG
ncbi:MAG: hypothetical protein ABIH82_03575 [Candidatus Woesearchaeota archaeon]